MEREMVFFLILYYSHSKDRLIQAVLAVLVETVYSNQK